MREKSSAQRRYGALTEVEILYEGDEKELAAGEGS